VADFRVAIAITVAPPLVIGALEKHQKVVSLNCRVFPETTTKVGTLSRP
jgi:hypothetical protein